MDELREFLESAKWAHARAARLSRKVAELEAQVSHITPSYTGMPGGGGTDVTKLWIALAELRSEYMAEVVKAERMEKAVSDFIDSLPTPEYRHLLHLRYCDRLRWPEMVRAMSGDGWFYSDRHLFRIHGRALNEARRIWRDKHEESRDS